MSNSPLVNYTQISPNRHSPRNHAIDTITIHCVVGQASVEALGNLFANPGRQASSNYGVGFDGRIGMYCPEGDRSWCSSSPANDHRAITIEVASDNFPPYAVNDVALNSLINLVADICKRNGIKKLLWENNSALIGNISRQNMTLHRWFAATECPGDYLIGKHPYIVQKVNEIIGGDTPTPVPSDLYCVQCGAFKEQTNADALEAKLKAAGFEVYKKPEGGLIKVQCGAFKNKENADALAEKLKAAGFDVYIAGGSTPTPTPTPTPIQVGDKVKVINAVQYGTGLPFTVYYDAYDVIEAIGDRIVIGIGSTVTAAVNASNLQKL